MKLYNGQTRPMSRAMIEELLKAEAVELEEGLEEEARLDMESVLREYIRVDRDINDSARDLMAAKGMSSNQFGKIKRRMAKERNFKIGDEAINWIIDQCIELLLYSNNIAEVFCDDRQLRIIIRKVIREFSEDETELDKEVRGKLRHLEEGSQSWDIEYQRAMDNLKRHKGLD